MKIALVDENSQVAKNFFSACKDEKIAETVKELMA